MSITLGTKATDAITGFTGTAISTTFFLHGCVYTRLQPTGLIDGKIPATEYFNQQSLLENSPIAVDADTEAIAMLGKKATDNTSGFSGVVMSFTTYLYGAPRVALKTKGLFEGKPIEPQDFDLGDLQFETATALAHKGGPGEVARRPATFRR
jgi:hypothetical protein